MEGPKFDYQAVMAALKSLYGKKNLFTCKVWKKDHSGYCSNCQARKRCLLGDELKKYTFSEQSEHTFTAQEVYNIQYEKKEIWKKKISETRRAVILEAKAEDAAKKMFTNKNREPDYIYSKDTSPEEPQLPETDIEKIPTIRVHLKREIKEEEEEGDDVTDEEPIIIKKEEGEGEIETDEEETMIIKEEEEENNNNKKETPRRSARLSPTQMTSPSSSPFFSFSPSEDNDDYDSDDSGSRRRKRTADDMVMNQDLPQLAKRKKKTEPLERPGYKDFNHALQNRKPEMFEVRKSLAPGAGDGLYFNGKCSAGELLTGYGGDRREITRGEADSHYSAQIGISKYAMDATRLSLASKKGNYDSTKFPLGHMVNRPPPGGKPNCRLSVRHRVLFVAARKAIDTKGLWIELYIPYNDKRV